jgi:hypothetical protein
MLAHQTVDANQGRLPLAVRQPPGCKRKPMLSRLQLLSKSIPSWKSKLMREEHFMRNVLPFAGLIVFIVGSVFAG